MLVGMKNDIATLKNNLLVTYETKHSYHNIPSLHFI